MSCTQHVLGFTITHHNWERKVTLTESLTDVHSDMWGRPVEDDSVHCHTKYVCRTCGAVRDECECNCEPDRAKNCKCRLELLAQEADVRH